MHLKSATKGIYEKNKKTKPKQKKKSVKKKKLKSWKTLGKESMKNEEEIIEYICDQKQRKRNQNRINNGIVF